ncbi:golgin subfamily A member 6-like protein 25 [Anopheles bellator]|uniref:golgin subfamily A member 6-like protein 25 n=1 Tax=Anopheles bellator TaxID=139047 RepID=UPI00264A10BE|nr:golgin subfamily A member 6-like protein 25 [Anopheles bellator]
MRSAKLQAALVKRREAEQIKYQKSAAVERYYDQWGRITSRFESWTTPQYYREAEEALRKREDDKRKAEALDTKRERLKELLARENEQLKKEMDDIARPKPKALSTEILEGVRARIQNAEEAKKRIDLEANLYSKWRSGVDRDGVIMDSRSPHQAMAKLNWIDRQVELQLQDEQDRREQQERDLRLHEEVRHREERLLEKSRMREQEIKELRSLQEVHMAELKTREHETNELNMYEVRLKTKKEEMAKELEALRVYNDRRRDRVMAMHNLRRIKMLLRERSEAVRTDLRHDLLLLQRISLDNPAATDSTDGIKYLSRKFQLQLDLEVEQQTAIENMYESEAKHNLAKWEDKWNSEAIIREQQLRCLLEDRLMEFEAKLIECAKRQRELIEVREQHIKAIENANQRLKALMSEKSRDECETSTNGGGQHRDRDREVRRPSTQSSQRSSTFSSIFPFDDPSFGVPSTGSKTRDATRLLPDKRGTNAEPEALVVPRFGRKKVAWC